MRAKILVGVPSAGAPLEVCNDHCYLASIRHDVDRLPSTTEGLNFNTLWWQALMQCEMGKYTHLAISHTDIRVNAEELLPLRWADVLIEQMEMFNLDFISVPNAIKDVRLLTSCGIGDPDDVWNPYRRFTTKELGQMPRTFTAEMIGYSDKYLIHNEALCMFDMRKPLWYELKPDGQVQCDFNVTEWVGKRNGQWVREQLTEDWKLSRDLWEMGARTGITTLIELYHYGLVPWSNRGEWGMYQNGDEDLARKWRKPGAPYTSPKHSNGEVQHARETVKAESEHCDSGATATDAGSNANAVANVGRSMSGAHCGRSDGGLPEHGAESGHLVSGGCSS